MTRAPSQPRHPWAGLAVAIAWLVLSHGAGVAWSTPLNLDVVFIIDASSSMAGEIAAVRRGLGDFITRLQAKGADARLAVVLFGGPPELVLDFTADHEATRRTFELIAVKGAVGGFQQDHNVNPEAGLEALRIILGMAAENTLRRDHVGGAGGLVFRPDARPHLILVTDEDADRPFYPANRLPGQTALEPRASGWGADWQAEIDATASAIIAKQAFVTLIMQPQDGLAIRQYGDPAQDDAAPDSQQFDPKATLAKLQATDARASLVAQVLAAGLRARAFDIRGLQDPAILPSIFAAVIEDEDLYPPPQVRRTKDWLEGLMETTTLIATFGLLAFMVERVTNGVALVLGYSAWWRLHMEPSAIADPIAQALLDRNRRASLFALSAVLAMTGAVLLKLDLLGKVGLDLGPGLAAYLATGLLLAAGADPLREVLKLGDRESKPPPPTPIQLTGTVILQHPLTVAVEKAPADGADARRG